MKKVIPRRVIERCSECPSHLRVDQCGIMSEVQWDRWGRTHSGFESIHPDCPLEDAPEPLKRPCFDSGGCECPENCDDFTGVDCTHKAKGGDWETCTSGKLYYQYKAEEGI